MDGANASQGFGRPRIPPLSSIAQVVVVVLVGPDVLGVVKHNGVRGGKHEKHRESGSGMEGRAGVVPFGSGSLRESGRNHWDFGLGVGEF